MSDFQSFDVTSSEADEWYANQLKNQQPSMDPVQGPQSPIAPAPEPKQEEVDIQEMITPPPSVSFWNNTGMMDPDVRDSARSSGEIDQVETEWRRQASRNNAETLEEYVNIADGLIQHYPYLAPHIKKSMLDSMPQKVKKEYEAKMQEVERKKKYVEEEKFNRWKQKYQSETLPDGWVIGLDGEAIPAYKAEIEKLKVMNQLSDDIRSAQKEVESARESMSSNLGELEEFRDFLIQKRAETRVFLYGAQEDQSGSMGLGLEQPVTNPATEKELYYDPTNEVSLWGEQGAAPQAGATKEEAALAPHQAGQVPQISPEDQEVLRMALANPNNPKAQRVLEVMQKKYGIQ